MLLRTAVCNLSRRFISSGGVRANLSVPLVEDLHGENKTYRETLAPWLKIGHFEPGILSHMSTSDILRAVFVLQACAFDRLVEHSPQLFEFALKLGPLSKWPLRKTFFDQFVGGEHLERMATVVKSMQKRGLTLMVLPVEEEDVDDAASSKNTYDNNIKSLLDLADMTASLEKNGPVLQLKVSAIIPCKVLEEVSSAILARSADPKQAAQLIEEIAESIDNPSKFPLSLSTEGTSHFLDGLKRADLLAKKAQKSSLHILVDAEFHSCRPAISAVALALMARYNGKTHFMGNTIQGYQKSAVTNIKHELEITKSIGVNWYGKVVRGAYMDRERKIAGAKGVASPIWDSYAETCKSYDSVVDILLREISKGKDSKPYLTVATHNENSIRLAAQKMKDFGIKKDAVSFAQIYGMADYLSTPLVQDGYKVSKSTPYGPMEQVMPYLSRRASENRSVISGAREERNILHQELMHRFNFK